MSSEQVLYIPYTFGPNFDKPGVTKEQIFWHMRNMNVGQIDHIDMKEKVDKKGINVRSWFVHFSTWTATPDITDALESGSHLEIDYDSYGHFWKIFKYMPKPPPAPTTENASGEFRIVSPSVPSLKLQPLPQKVLTKIDIKRQFEEFVKINEQKIPFVEGLTDQEYHIAEQMQNDFDIMLQENRYGRINELEEYTMNNSPFFSAWTQHQHPRSWSQIVAN